jgi:predicted glycosyltransferase
MTDYEGHPGMKIVCRLARRILVPAIFDLDNLRGIGATRGKIQHYSGIKEEIYLSDFEPDLNFRAALGVPPSRILVTMRPASEVAAYHQFENLLFDEAMKVIDRHDNVTIIALPRTKEQRERFTKLQLSNLLMPDRALDGPNLVFCSDLVVGAGGTMNREAVALGTPAYTLFGSSLGSVDRYLVGHGVMHHVSTVADLATIVVEQKHTPRRKNAMNNQVQLKGLVDQILAASPYKLKERPD